MTRRLTKLHPFMPELWWKVELRKKNSCPAGFEPATAGSIRNCFIHGHSATSAASTYVRRVNVLTTSLVPRRNAVVWERRHGDSFPVLMPLFRSQSVENTLRDGRRWRSATVSLPERA